MSSHTRREVADHVRRIHNAYYYDAYKNLAREDSTMESPQTEESVPFPGAAGMGSPDSQGPLASEDTDCSYTACSPTTYYVKRLDFQRHAVSPNAMEAVITSGNGNRPLTEAVALVLGVKTHETSVVQYESGEVHVDLHAPVIGRDVYIIQSTGSNSVVDVNTAVMELLLLIRKIRLQHPKTITAIIPFLGYSRQDRRTNLRGTIPAAAIARMITSMGVDRVATLDLHSNQTQGYFDSVPLDNLVMVYEFAKYFRNQSWFNKDTVAIVAPDAGGVERARRLADVLSVGHIVTIIKRKYTDIHGNNQTVMETAGTVDGLHCIIVDDIVDTGTTLVQASNLLKKLGAKNVSACSSHGTLSSPSEKNIMECDILKELVVSDSIPQEEHERRIPKLKVVSIAPLLASVIRTYEQGRSLACLFPA